MTSTEKINGGSGSNHALKAAEALGNLSASASAAAEVTSFYDVPVKKNNFVEENNQSVDGEEEQNDQSNYDLELRIAGVESSLSALSIDVGESNSETLALRGELKSFIVSLETRLCTLQSDQKKSNELLQKQNDEQNKLLSDQEMNMQKLRERIELLQKNNDKQSKLLSDQDINMQKLLEKIELLQKNNDKQNKVLSDQDINMQNLREKIELLQKNNDMNMQKLEGEISEKNRQYDNKMMEYENKLKQQNESICNQQKNIDTSNQHTEDSMEQLASDLLIHIRNEVLKVKQKLALCWKDAKDTTLIEKQRMNLITVQSQKIFEDQILQTVETIGKLKRALDSQINALEQHVSVGQKERNKMMKSSCKLEERVESLDRELTAGMSHITQASKQAWEAARLANDSKDDVRKMERQISKLMGAVTQSRESTMMALSHMRNSQVKNSFEGSKSGGTNLGLSMKSESSIKSSSPIRIQIHEKGLQ